MTNKTMLQLPIQWLEDENQKIFPNSQISFNEETGFISVLDDNDIVHEGIIIAYGHKWVKEDDQEVNWESVYNNTVKDPNYFTHSKEIVGFLDFDKDEKNILSVIEIKDQNNRVKLDNWLNSLPQDQFRKMIPIQNLIEG